jgi:hypothetical protein
MEKRERWLFFCSIPDTTQELFEAFENYESFEKSCGPGLVGS